MTIEKLQLPPGRIVWGHPKKPKVKKNYTTKQPVIKDGVQVMEWAFGYAIERNAFLEQVWPLMSQEASTLYPNGVPKDFSWKFVDGDNDLDKNNKPYSQREGYAGHYVLNVTTEAFAPPVFKFENGAYRELDENEIKTGDFVVLSTNMKAHANNDGGIYVNPNALELIGYGEEIVTSGSNPDELFGGQQHALPPGASAAPLSSAPAGALPPGTPAAAPVPAAVPMAQPVPATAPAPVAAAPAAMPPPAHDFVHNAGQPALATAPAPVAQPTMAPHAAHAAPPAAVPMAQPVPATAPAPVAAAPAAMPPPAHDFVHNAGQPALATAPAPVAQPTMAPHAAHAAPPAAVPTAAPAGLPPVR